MRTVSLIAMLLAAAMPLAAANAQMPGAPPPQGAGGPGGGAPNFGAGPLTVNPLTPSIYWVKGGVGNVGIIVGDKGVIVVDTTVSPASAKELLADIAKITPKPVTTVILTHGDIDHVGGLSAFPAGIEVIAQNANKARMDSQAASGRGTPVSGPRPNHGVDTHEAIERDGVKLQLFHWAPAHTAGDLVIFVPAQKIVFTGDIFALDQPRALIHREQQGSSEGWVATAKGIVSLDATRFVVGHGDVQTKAALEQRIALVTDERAKIEALVAKGETLPQIEATVGDPPAGQAAGGPGGPRFTPFAEVVYQELTEKK